MSTLEEKDKSTEGQQQHQDISANTKSGTTTITAQKLPFASWTESLGQEYQDKIKRYATMPDFKIHIAIDGGPKREVVRFARMKLLQYQFEEIEDLRAEMMDLTTAGKTRQAETVSRQMYRKAASYILWNISADRPMSEDEFKYADISESRPAIDSSLLITLLDPKPSTVYGIS
jgi:hypothetical protein